MHYLKENQRQQGTGTRTDRSDRTDTGYQLKAEALQLARRVRKVRRLTDRSDRPVGKSLVQEGLSRTRRISRFAEWSFVLGLNRSDRPVGYISCSLTAVSCRESYRVEILPTNSLFFPDRSDRKGFEMLR